MLFWHRLVFFRFNLNNFRNPNSCRYNENNFYNCYFLFVLLFKLRGPYRLAIGAGNEARDLFSASSNEAHIIIAEDFFAHLLGDAEFIKKGGIYFKPFARPFRAVDIRAAVCTVHNIIRYVVAYGEELSE